MKLLRSLLPLLSLLLLLPSVASAQFTADKPKEVGTVFLPFQAEREADDSLAFLLEDLVGARLKRSVRRPVHTGRDVTVALTGTPESCLGQPECVQLLGGQFNSSLVAWVLVTRAGSDVKLETSWYTTGNGLRAHKETISFPVGQEDTMLSELARVIESLFEPSLLITPTTLAREGGIISGGDQEDPEELRRAREKKVRSRREDFGSSSPERLETDEPETDLRSAVEEEEDDEDDANGSMTIRTSDDRKGRSRGKDRAEPVVSEEEVASDLGDDDDREVDLDAEEDLDDEDDLDSDEPVDDPDEGISLRASEDRGDTVSNYMQAQKLGIGKREYGRLTRTGLPFDEYMDRRWAYGKRFFVKVAAFYGLGGLTRRYSTAIFVRAGNVLTEEYRWESLGESYVNPGGQIGIGFAPLDFLEVDLDVGVMLASQELRRDYYTQELGNQQGDPESLTTAHLVADLKARFLVFPKGRVKLTPQIGATVLVMAGYQVNSEPPLAYSSRPVAAVFGVTGGIGTIITLGPFVGLDIDLTGTFFAAEGATKMQEYELFNGITEGYLPETAKQPPVPSIPAMGRITIGPRFLF